MNQQQDMFYGGYSMGNGNNRSPSLSRPGYATASGLHPAHRPNQRQMEAVAQQQQQNQNQNQNPNQYAEDRFNTYDTAFRPNRLQPIQGFPDPFMLNNNNNNNNNNQSWNYNAGAATVNGAMGDGGRLRPSNRRGQIPSEWTSVPEQSLGGQGGMPGAPGYPGPPILNQQNLGMMNGGLPNDRHLYQNNYGAMPLRSLDEKSSGANSDLIPTAIVIKNIPFNIRKETLTQMMTEMCLPQPYAFNYHFDQGVFRGLAFANFQNAEDTATVIDKMNGLDVQGRKLRVEYKKMLPEHERERIEREKREKRGQLEEQHRPLTLHPQASLHSLTNAGNSNGQRNSPMRTSPGPGPGPGPVPTATRTPTNVPVGDIDLNDPPTLGFYTDLTLFRNDPSREIFIFPNSITPVQRRTIHILAHNMGLEHRSVGEGQHRQLHILKTDLNRAASPAIQPPPHLPPGVPLDAHRRGLSRAATIDFAESRMASAGNYHAIGRQGNPMLELPGSPDAVSGLNGLRGVKSFADLRSYTPSPSPSVTGYGQANGGDAGHVAARFAEYTQTSSLTTPTTPGAGGLSAPSMNDPASLLMGMSALGLGPFDGGNSQMRPRETPGAIGSQRPGMNGNGRANVPERQPRGPASAEWESTGFAGRGRANGHTQRGSDSSETAPRNVLSSGQSRFH